MGLKRVSGRRDDALTRVGWQALERLLADYYRMQGYAVEHVGTGATDARYDGGIDLKLRRAEEYVLVQVKHWNAYKVPHNDVHQLLGLMVNEGATGAILVTSGEFTQAAIQAANRQGHVRLVDGRELRKMLGPDALAKESLAPDRAAEIAQAVTVPVGDRRPPRVRSSGPVPSVETRAWLVVALIGSLVSGLLIWGLFKRTEGTAGRTSPGESAGMPSYQFEVVEAAAPPPSAISQQPSQTSDPCKEVIDNFSGTTIDQCAPRNPPARMSPAEAREQQRRADEAARILEASTPEM